MNYFTEDTGPVDFYDPSNPVILEMAAADRAAQPRLPNGAAGGGRFTFADRPLEYGHLRRAPMQAVIRKPPEFTDEPGVTTAVVVSCCVECVWGPASC